MMKKHFLTFPFPSAALRILMLCMLFTTAVRAEPVTLTDTQGRSIDAKILGMAGDNVNVQLANMRLYKIPMTKLDKPSQQRVHDWVAKQIREHREPFKISIRNFTENKVDRKSPAKRIKTYDEGYEVKVENQMTMPVSGLTLEYLILKEGAILAAHSDKEIEIEVLKGKVKLKDMGLRGTSDFRTETMPITEDRLRGNWFYTDGGKDNAVDDLGGIWIKIKSGDTVVFEYAKPTTLPEKVKWDQP